MKTLSFSGFWVTHTHIQVTIFQGNLITKLYYYYIQHHKRASSFGKLVFASDHTYLHAVSAVKQLLLTELSISIISNLAVISSAKYKSFHMILLQLFVFYFRL